MPLIPRATSRLIRPREFFRTKLLRLEAFFFANSPRQQVASSFSFLAQFLPSATKAFLLGANQLRTWECAELLSFLQQAN